MAVRTSISLISMAALLQGVSGQSGQCTATPMSPPMGSGLPDATIFTVNSSTVPAQCGEPCFSEECYKEVPQECCEGGIVFGEMSSLFASDTCMGPVSPAEGINVYLAGGCGDDGKLFYGEMCGGSNFGAFKSLADGTVLGQGNCVQPNETCKCNAYIHTAKAGCYNIGTPPNSPIRYFLKVKDAVCKPLDCTSCAEGYEKNGGCKASETPGAETDSMVPAGCQRCGMAAMAHCKAMGYNIPNEADSTATPMMQKCGDVKREYKMQGCCGNPTKTFNMGSGSGDANRRLSDEDLLLEELKHVLHRTKMQRGPAEARNLAKSIKGLLAEHTDATP